MPSFLTQCPHCLTPFRVTETQLEAAAGQVRCGACLGIFSATSNRITLKQTPEEAAMSGAPEPEEPPAPEAGAENPAEEILPDLLEEPQADFPVERVVTAPLDEPLHPEFPPQEPAPIQVTAATSVYATDTVLDSPSHERDFDVPLGDLDLDSDEDFEESTDDEYEDDADADADELDDEQDEEDAEEFANDDEVEDEVDDDEADDDLPEPLVRRAPVERTVTDKTALRQHLAELEDDEALEPLDDNALESFADEPVTLSAAPRRRGLYTFALFSTNLVLLAVLVLQYFHANLDTLNRSTRMAPLMPYVCQILECPRIERSQLGSLVSEQLLVRSHPAYAQALEVSFIFRNDAAEAQPFPALEIGFNDTNNQLLANRVFKPAEYLPPELQTSEMPAQSSLQITLEMVDPGSEAVNYTLAFRAP